MIEAFPREVISDVPRITLTGRNMLHVEQHKGLVAYQHDHIELRTASGMLVVTGNGLVFSMYDAAEAVVTGEIDGVTLRQMGGTR